MWTELSSTEEKSINQSYQTHSLFFFPDRKVVDFQLSSNEIPASIFGLLWSSVLITEMISTGNWVLLLVVGVQQLLGRNNPILLIQRTFQILCEGSCGEMTQKYHRKILFSNL